MGGPGRDSKFDDDRRAKILADLAAGTSRKCAAERAGVSDRTLRRWLARGRGPAREEPFVSFLSALIRAERDGELSAVKQLLAIGHGRILVKRTVRHKRDGTEVVTETFNRPMWQPLAWWLERKFPVEWGKDNEILQQVIADFRKKKAEAEGWSRGRPG
jgi:hypothetical protein